MLKVAIDPNQTKITDYYKLLDKIESLASSSSEYGSIINEVDKIQRERLTMCHPELETEKFGSLFKQMLENITLNANKVPQARRHDHIIKSFRRHSSYMLVQELTISFTETYQMVCHVFELFKELRGLNTSP